MALHALTYCERLFYLEEVEEIRLADDRVWAGRREHFDLDEPGEIVNLTLESEDLGIRGRLDALRRRDGASYPIEHKRGKSRRGSKGEHLAWQSDRIQVGAYALLLEEYEKRPIEEGRIHYHADHLTLRLPLDAVLRNDVAASIARARELAASHFRPPVTAHEGRCAQCSLAPVCLPEEQRFVEAKRQRGPSGHLVSTTGDSRPARYKAKRLFPPDSDKRPLHVVTAGTKVGRRGEALKTTDRDGSRNDVSPRDVSDIVLHGNTQISTQALRLCLDRRIPVHILSHGGAYLGSVASPAGVQRKIRQFEALTDRAICFHLSVVLQKAKVELQLRHILRATRKRPRLRDALEAQIAILRLSLRQIARLADNPLSADTDLWRDRIMGHEGLAARSYLEALSAIVASVADERFVPGGRSRRPPRDRFNALLSFGYSLLYRDVVSAIFIVGLDPAFGFLHKPRTAAFPLALDIMEIFRVPVVDMAILGSINRRSFDPDQDFNITTPRVWLSESGRRKAISIYERRKQEEHKHPILNYRVSYARMIDLEVRLLEKEWSGEAGLFGRLRIR